MKKSAYSSLVEKSSLLDKMTAHFDKEVISAKELHAYVKLNKIAFPYFITKERKVGRGQFSIVPKHVGCVTPAASKQTDEVPVAAAAMVAQVVQLASKRASNVTESFVPDRNETYVPFGFYNDMRDIIKSRIFYPIYITGLSGNGKTMMIEQVCAALKRELIRVNITKRTDESDLIGSYELVDGNTIRREGPVITAMRRGAVLLLDGDGKTLKKCFVEQIGSDEPTIVAALALRVRSRNHVEASSRMDDFTSFLVEVWLALKNRLKAEDILGAEIALIKKQHSTTTHRCNHRTFTTDGIAIYQFVRTDQVRLIRALRDVDSDQLTLERSTNLLNHHRLAIT